MIMDSLLFFDGSQSATGVLTGTVINTAWANPPTTTTYYSANILDVSQVASSASGYGRDIGVGDDLWLVVSATVAVCGSANTSTLQIALQALLRTVPALRVTDADSCVQSGLCGDQRFTIYNPCRRPGSIENHDPAC